MKRIRRRKKNNQKIRWRGATRKKTKKTKRKKLKEGLWGQEKKNAMKKWEFIFKNRNSNEQNPQRVPSN